MKEYIPVVPNPTQSPNSNMPIKSGSISPLMIVLYFLTLSLIGVSSYFVFQNMDLKKQITTKETQPFETTDSTQSLFTTSSDKLTKYTYSNNDEGVFYSMEYPNYFEVREDIYQGIHFISFQYAKNPDQIDYDVDFTVSVEGFEGDLKSFLDNKYSEKLSTFTEPITHIKVGDLEGYYFVFNREGSIKAIYFPVKDNLCLVVVYKISGDGKLNTLSDEMLRSIIVE